MGVQRDTGGEQWWLSKCGEMSFRSVKKTSYISPVHNNPWGSQQTWNKVLFGLLWKQTSKTKPSAIRKTQNILGSRIAWITHCFKEKNRNYWFLDVPSSGLQISGACTKREMRKGVVFVSWRGKSHGLCPVRICAVCRAFSNSGIQY